MMNVNGDAAQEQRSLLLALRSAVLPEGDVIVMNMDHRAAAAVRPLTTRPFRFQEWLHCAPLRRVYG